jgi:spore maturation protein CgeB
MHLCYSRSVQQRIEKEYGIPTAFLPFGFELEEEVFNEIKNQSEILAACFIGNPDKIRVEHLIFLAKSGLQIDVYGHGWNRFLPKLPNVRIFDAVYEKDFWRTLHSYRLQINIFRPHNRGSHNMRSFEVPASGTIMLAPDSSEHREFFQPGEEIFTYSSKRELVAQARFILELSAQEASRIRDNARQRAVNSGYSYRNRAFQACRAIEQLLESKTSRTLAAAQN